MYYWCSISISLIKVCLFGLTYTYMPLSCDRYIYLLIPPHWKDMTHGQFLSGVLLVSIQSFPPRLVCLTKAEKLSLPYYLPIVGGRIIGFIPFPRVLVRCEMQSASSKIWTRVIVSISHDDNHYPTTLVIDIWDRTDTLWSDNIHQTNWYIYIPTVHFTSLFIKHMKPLKNSFPKVYN